MRQWSLLGTSEERESPEISQGRRGMLVAIQEDQAGELGLRRLHLKYNKKRALKRLMNPEPYYRYPRVESYYFTCDTRAD